MVCFGRTWQARSAFGTTHSQKCRPWSLYYWKYPDDLARFSLWLIDRRIPLERVHFNYERPSHADEYDALFFAPVCNLIQFRTEITFAADYLDLPIRQDANTLEEFLKPHQHNCWWSLKNNNSLTSRIRDVLKSQIGEEMPTLNDVGFDAVSFSANP